MVLSSSRKVNRSDTAPRPDALRGDTENAFSGAVAKEKKTQPVDGARAIPVARKKFTLEESFPGPLKPTYIPRQLPFPVLLESQSHGPLRPTVTPAVAPHATKEEISTTLALLSAQLDAVEGMNIRKAELLVILAFQSGLAVPKAVGSASSRPAKRFDLLPMPKTAPSICTEEEEEAEEEEYDEITDDHIRNIIKHVKAALAQEVLAGRGGLRPPLSRQSTPLDGFPVKPAKPDEPTLQETVFRRRMFYWAHHYWGKLALPEWDLDASELDRDLPPQGPLGTPSGVVRKTVEPTLTFAERLSQFIRRKKMLPQYTFEHAPRESFSKPLEKETTSEEPKEKTKPRRSLADAGRLATQRLLKRGSSPSS